MKTRLLVYVVVMVALVASAATAENWGPYVSNYGDSSLLAISRSDLGSGVFEWMFSVHNAGVSHSSLHYFSVGLLVNDTGGAEVGDLTSGHFFGYSSSFATAQAVEMPESAIWFGFTLTYGQDGWFKLKTDLPSVGYATHEARDHTYTPYWESKETPIPIPEPASLLILVSGLGAAAGFRLKRR